MLFDPQQYAAYLVTEGMSDGTIRNYVPFYARWMDWAITHGRDPAVFAPLDVREWSRTIHPSRAMLDLASAAIRHAARMYGAAEPTGAIPKPRTPKRDPDALTSDVAAQLARAAHTAGIAGTAVLVGLYTAARRSEIAGMAWADVGDETISWWRPKTRDRHAIPLHPTLRDHLEPRRSGQWLFPGRYGGHVAPAQINTWVAQVGDLAGVGHVRPKQLRATALTVINEVTGLLLAAQKIAGHTKVTTTQRYVRVGARALRAAVGALDHLEEPDLEKPDEVAA